MVTQLIATPGTRLHLHGQVREMTEENARATQAERLKTWQHSMVK